MTTRTYESTNNHLARPLVSSSRTKPFQFSHVALYAFQVGLRITRFNIRAGEQVFWHFTIKLMIWQDQGKTENTDEFLVIGLIVCSVQLSNLVQ